MGVQEFPFPHISRNQYDMNRIFKCPAIKQLSKTLAKLKQQKYVKFVVTYIYNLSSDQAPNNITKHKGRSKEKKKQQVKQPKQNKTNNLWQFSTPGQF